MAPRGAPGTRPPGSDIPVLCRAPATALSRFSQCARHPATIFAPQSQLYFFSFPFFLFVFSFLPLTILLYYITIYLTFTTSAVGTRRGASASTFRRKKSHADFADTQIYRGLMRIISEKVSQIMRITQIAIRREYVESISGICGINFKCNQL